MHRRYDGYLMTHEGYFYALDAIPLFLAVLLFVFVYPHACLSKAGPSEAATQSPASATSLKALRADTLEEGRW